ncbi:MAG: D-2-hydroxyacid dehydrogenase family protein [Actinobacteria bacterium]|nr:D-2-hydroxyacid dehydrogenase family protein [Actinomycetota bacterium]
MNVVVLDDFHSVARSLGQWDTLGDRVELVIHTDHVSEDEAVVARLERAHVVVVMRERTPLTRQRLERLPHLKLIVTTGMENKAIDMACAEERGVVVCGTRGGLSNAVEHTWALILAHLRNLSAEENNIRSGGWQTTIGRDLFGSTIGLVGLGRTGTRMARVARAFDMNILAWSPHLTPEVAETHGATAVSKERLFTESDIVSVHLQLSDSTRGIIGAGDIARMKKSALFVNTSRGALVDEAALENAVRNGAIAGAALDVFANEPLPADSSMRSLPNSVLTPHVGYVTEGLYRRFFSDIVEDIAMHLAGTPVRVLNN